jgi:SAM-dependent methyltransferase
MLQNAKQTIRERIWRMVKPAVKAMVAQRLLPQDERIHSNSFIVGKLYPFNTQTTDYVVPLEPRAASFHNALPVPPMELWEGYAETTEEYVASGENDMRILLDGIRKAGANPQNFLRVLDLGCAAGRMLRHFPHNGHTELWGSDINARYINWCQQQFGHPFFFITNTTAPHLPFDDGSFDLVYCGSVFTHITDIADSWLLEIRRILRTGGYAYITIHDEDTLNVLFTKYKDKPLFSEFAGSVRRFYEAASIQTNAYAYFTIEADPVSQVFYNRKYLLEKWGRFVNVLSVTPEAHDHQTAVVLQKR